MKMIALMSAAAIILGGIAVSAPADAKAHHTPMAAPIDCGGDFDCLHPGYVAALKFTGTLTADAAGTTCKVSHPVTVGSGPTAIHGAACDQY